MRRTTQRMINAIAISAVTAVSMGCSSDAMLNLNTAVSDSREQARIVEGDALDQLTIGDLVVGFQQFASSIPEDGIINAPFLTTEQQLEIEALQESLNVGEISQEEFGDAVREIIGDLLPGRAFVGFGAWGGPFGIRPRGDVLIDLELTDEQKEQAQLIFEQLQDVILTRRDEMHQAFLEILTDEQLAVLEGIENPTFGGFRGGRRFGGGFLSMGMMQLGVPADKRVSFGDRLAEFLSLADEQQVSLAELRDALRDDVQLFHEQARDAFVDLLTPEQVGIIESLDQS